MRLIRNEMAELQTIKSLTVLEYNLLRELLSLAQKLNRAPTTFEITKFIEVEPIYVGHFFQKVKGGWDGLVEYLNKSVEV